jgi:hypothetical protein
MRHRAGGAKDLVVESDWGIGLLTFKPPADPNEPGTLESIYVMPNGSRFGNWLYSSREDLIVGAGDVNRDGNDDLVVISSWGIGVLTLNEVGLDSVTLSPNGTRFGAFRFSSIFWHVGVPHSF